MINPQLRPVFYWAVWTVMRGFSLTAVLNCGLYLLLNCGNHTQNTCCKITAAVCDSSEHICLHWSSLAGVHMSQCPGLNISTLRYRHVCNSAALLRPDMQKVIFTKLSHKNITTLQSDSCGCLLCHWGSSSVAMLWTSSLRLPRINKRFFHRIKTFNFRTIKPMKRCFFVNMLCGVLVWFTGLSRWPSCWKKSSCTKRFKPSRTCRVKHHDHGPSVAPWVGHISQYVPSRQSNWLSSSTVQLPVQELAPRAVRWLARVVQSPRSHLDPQILLQSPRVVL